MDTFGHLWTSKSQEAYGNVVVIVEQTIGKIQTVYSFAGEKTAPQTFADSIDPPTLKLDGVDIWTLHLWWLRDQIDLVTFVSELHNAYRTQVMIMFYLKLRVAESRVFMWENEACNCLVARSKGWLVIARAMLKSPKVS